MSDALSLSDPITGRIINSCLFLYPRVRNISSPAQFPERSFLYHLFHSLLVFPCIFGFIINKLPTAFELRPLPIIGDLFTKPGYEIFADAIKFHTSKKLAQKITGIVNIVIGLINVIAPGQNIFKVFKTEDFTLIPIVTICFQCLCSAFWGFYGFKDMDINIIFPNILGTVLALIQISIYFYFYCKRKGVPPEKSKKDPELEEGDDEEKEEDNNLKEEMVKKNEDN